MGGVAKGQILREVDALGGMSGRISDRSAIQFRMLNRSKGPAMWSPRTQNDRHAFANEWRMTLEAHPNIHLWQDMVTTLIIQNGSVRGVRTQLGLDIYAQSTILTSGTFLQGRIHLGHQQFQGGRSGERAAEGLARPKSVCDAALRRACKAMAPSQRLHVKGSKSMASDQPHQSNGAKD